MKLVLIQPPIQDFYETDIRLQPIGLAYLKAAVQKWCPEIQVVIRDFHRGRGRKTIPIPKDLRHLKPYYKERDESPFSTFHAYYHFGADFETIAEEVTREKPDLIGISSLFTPYYREVLETARSIKSRMEVPILVGGSHVSACPGHLLKDPAIDFEIRGEGEKPLVEFLKALQTDKSFSTVPNLSYKIKSQMIENHTQEPFPLEDLPLPDLSDFKLQDYTFEGKPLCFLITSRSCPHRCSFCSVHQTFGFEFRRRSTESILNEIRARYDQGYRVFDFEDDNLTYFKKGMKDLLRAIIAEWQGKEIRFVAMNGISYLSLDEELLDLMKEAGFTDLNLALVSSDDSVRESTKRPHTIQKYLAVVKKAFELGLRVTSYQILGLPNEPLDSMIQTLAFQAGLPVLLGASPFYLTPGTPIAASQPKQNESGYFLSRLTALGIDNPHHNQNEIFTLFILTRIVNHLKSLPLAGDVSIDRALEISQNLDKRSAVGAEILDKLFQSSQFFGKNKNGLYPQPCFSGELFEGAWNQIKTIKTQDGKNIFTTSKETSCLLSNDPSR